MGWFKCSTTWAQLPLGARAWRLPHCACRTLRPAVQDRLPGGPADAGAGSPAAAQRLLQGAGSQLPAAGVHLPTAQESHLLGGHWSSRLVP